MRVMRERGNRLNCADLDHSIPNRAGVLWVHQIANDLGSGQKQNNLDPIRPGPHMSPLERKYRGKKDNSSVFREPTGESHKRLKTPRNEPRRRGIDP